MQGDRIRKKKRKNLRVKLFQTIISLVAATILIFTMLGVVQFIRFIVLIDRSDAVEDEVIVRTMTDTMRSEATGNFQKYVEADAEIIDHTFLNMKQDMELLAVNVKEILKNPDTYGEIEVLPPSASDAGKKTGQLLFSRNADRSDEGMMRTIRKLGNLQPQMRQIVEENEAITDCVIALAGGANLYMDRHPEQKIDEDGTVVPYDTDRRPFYVGALLNMETYFAPANLDYFGSGYEVQIGVPVIIDGEVQAVCGCGRVLSDFKQIIEGMGLGDDSFMCLIDEAGYIIYSQKDSGELSIKGNHYTGSVLNSSNIELVDFVENALTGGKGCKELMIDGEETYLAYAPLSTVGWTLILGISEKALEAPAVKLSGEVSRISNEAIDTTHRMGGQAQILVIVVALILTAAAVFVCLRLSERLVTPIIALKDAGLEFINREEVELDLSEGSYFGELELYTGDEVEDLWVMMTDLEVNFVTSASFLKSMTAEKEKMDTELSLATNIQTAVLPKDFPAFPDRKEFDLYATMHPAKEVGGDFYDFFLIDDDHLALVIGDVSDKGVPAALFMMAAHTMIESAYNPGDTIRHPSEVFRMINERLMKKSEIGMFVTVWVGIVTISTGEVLAANAGHEYPAIFRASNKDEGFSFYKVPHSPPLAAFPGSPFRSEDLKLEKGDVLFVYTDGVSEAHDHDEELFGEGRMLKTLNRCCDMTPEEIVNSMRNDTAAFAAGAEQFDDITMLCFKYYGN